MGEHGAAPGRGQHVRPGELGLLLGGGAGHERGDLGLRLVAAGGAEDGDQDRQAERAADLLGGVEQPGGCARFVVGDAGDRGQGQRDEGEAEAEAEQAHRPEHPAEVAAVGLDLGEPEHRQGGEPGAGDQDRLRADPGQQRLGGAGGDQDRHRDRQEADAGADRAVAEHVLHVQDQEEEQSEQ